MSSRARVKSRNASCAPSGTHPAVSSPARCSLANDKLSRRSVLRELERLAAAQLVNVSKIGNQKHYQANRQAPIFAELRSIALKTFGVADYLRDALAPLAKRMHAAFIYEI